MGLFSWLVLFFFVADVRKLLETKRIDPRLDQTLHVLRLVATGLLFFSLGDVLPDLLERWLWLVLFGTVFGVLYRLRAQRGALPLLWAFLPMTGLLAIDVLSRTIVPTFYHKYDGTVEALGVFAVIGLFISVRTTKNQHKALAQAEAKRLEEEEKKRLVEGQNAELERLVAARTAELTERNQALETTLADLHATQTQLIQSEKMASLGELTAGIAHEIQNPLNFVNNFSEVSVELLGELREGPLQKLPDSEKEYVEEILGDLSQNLQKITHHGKRADAIVKGMLQHSRASTGQKQPTNLNALADEYLRLSYHGLRAKDKAFNADLKTDFDPTLDLIDAVPQDLGRVLLNLFNNAFYAVFEKQKQQPEGYQPRVSVSTRRVGEGVELCVTDNGTGIPESVRQKIFQPFFTTKPTGQGTGLGLSLSYDIVTKGHGGTLTVESTEGEGSTFRVSLPGTA
jgi:signal transduction histidine kinase